MEITNERIREIVDEYLEEIGGFDALEGPHEFIELLNLVFEILKSDYPYDFGMFFDKNGELKSYQELCKLKKIKLTFNPIAATRSHFSNLTTHAMKEGKIMPLCYHLVGANLQLAFPNDPISNKPVNTTDQNTACHGNFVVGDTIFYVITTPMPLLFEKCQENIAKGHKVYVLIPDFIIHRTREMANRICNGYVTVEPIESFISQSIERASQFSSKQLKSKFMHLIELYNARIDAVEIDKSSMIELLES